MTTHEVAFYRRVFEALAQPASQRYALMAQLHTDVCAGYVAALRALSIADAARAGDDRRRAVFVDHHAGA